MKIKRLLFCLALLAAATCLQAQAPAGQAAGEAQATRDVRQLSKQEIDEIADLSVLQRMAAGYAKIGDGERLTWTYERLYALFPNSGDYAFALAALHARKGDKTKTYDILLKMKEQGYGIDLVNDKRFEKVADTELWQYLSQSLKANMAPFGEGKLAFELPKGDTLYESLAWDPKRQQLLVGSARDGSIQLVSKDGKLKPFIQPDATNGLWGVYALAADAPRDLLYVAAAASTYFRGFSEADLGKSAVFKFQLSSGKFLARYLAPGEGTHTLTSITVGKGGQMFVADGRRNVIYRVDGDALKVVAADPNLKSLRGLAVSDDGKLLYFADYMLGIFGIHLATGKGFAVEYNPASLALGGIDGLYWYDGTLVAIENGMRPQRVMRLTLSPEGSKITRVMPLDVARPEFKLPTYGAVAGDKLYFIANSQRNLYGQYGDLKQDAVPEPVKVFESDLRFAWGQTGINTSVMPVRAAPLDEGKKLMQTKPSLMDGPEPRVEPETPETKKSDDKKGD
ncbi:MAG: hypothetical protein J0L88_02225 [Xanthomonadales bacterium]|nr:hypothetical protein [Xanthomonadales bacterium]